MIEQPFTINENVFEYGNNFTSAILYVPKGTKAKYEATDGWKKFTNIVEMEWMKQGDVNGDGAVNVADVGSVIDCMSGVSTVDRIAADANGDGKVDVADIATIIDIMAGK